MPPGFGYFGRYLRFKSKPIFLQLDGSQDLFLEHFVARPHIREIQVGQHVGHESEEFIADCVPEEQHAVRPSLKSRTIDHIRHALLDRFNQPKVVLRIILKISILNEHQFPFSRLKPSHRQEVCK